MLEHPPASFARELAEKAKCYSAANYCSYIINTARGGHIYARLRNIGSVFAPALWIGRIARILRWVFTVIETSAVLLAIAVLLLVILPFFLVGTVLLVLISFVYCQQADRVYRPLLTDKRVLVFCTEHRTPFFIANLQSLSTDYTVLLVGDLPQENKASHGMRFLYPVFQAGDNVLYIRERYYFHLRRKYLRHAKFFALIF